MNRSPLPPRTGRAFTLLLAALAFAALTPTLRALDGDIRVHDPSTIIQCDGRYYVFSTGRGIPILSSDDGWTWKRAGHVFDQVPDSVHKAVPLNKDALVWAPDICKRNGHYFLYYSISTWGSSVSAIGLLTSPTLNPADPHYQWTDRGLIVNSVEGEQLNTIDPGVLQAPDGTMWLCYGSYIGDVQVVQLDPVTGLRIRKDSPTPNLSSQSEASDLIYHDGYYYLFVNRGTCCEGPHSTYNIRMGRSKVVTGPYLDRYGVDMAKGGGDLFLASAGGQIGPGHFGLLLDDGLEKFSCHYESGPDQHGSSLDIRPLLWIDGWPAPGINLTQGTYQIRSKRTGLNLQTTQSKDSQEPLVVQDRYIVHDHQQWTLSPVAGYFKLLNADSKLALQSASSATNADHADVEVAADTGTDTQLWKINQVSDGTFRIISKTTHFALTANARGPEEKHLSLTPYTATDIQKWIITTP